MADEIASLKVVIEAEDRASAVISSVGASMSGLGSAGAAAAGQTAAVNAAMTGSAKSSAVLGSAVTQTKNNLKQLESGLANQKATTLEYTKSLRDSANTLREKQTAVQDAAKAYKSNTASIKENISGLEDQRKHLDSLTNINNQIISYAAEQNKGLSKNSAAYKENAATIKRVTAENKELAVQRKENMNAILANESALKQEEQNYKNAQTAVKGAAKSYEEIRDKVKQSKAAEVDYSNSIDKVNAELLKKQQEYEKLQKNESIIDTGKAWKEVGSSIDTITKPLQIASVAIAGLETASAMAAISFEDNFASVEKTVDGTDEQLAQIKQDIIDMTTVGIDGHSAIPLTTAELTELAAAGGQLGIATENISSFTETMAMLGTATNLSGEQGAQTLARFMNVTSTSQDQISNLGSAIVDLGNNFATTEAEIADMALSMGATGSVVGISAQDVLAYSTALSSLGVDAAAGGSAVSRIWMDIQSAVSAGGEDLQKFAKLSGKSSKEFAAQWKDDASGAFQDFLKGLSQDKDQISTLADLGFNNIRDIQALQRLAGETGFDLLTDAIERANTAWSEDTALLNEFEKKAETTASKIQIVKSNAAEAARSFGETMLPTIVDVTGGLSSMAQGLASASDGTKKFVVGAGAAVVGLGALSKGVAGTVKTVGGIIESVGTIKKAFAKGGALAKFAPTLTAIGSAAGPATIGIAATAAATVGLYEAAKAYEEYKSDWSRGGEEMATAIRSHAEATRELNDLQYELRSLQQVVNNPETDESTLNSSKARIEEIKQLLSEKYNLDITVNDSELDAAIEKAKQLQLLETKQQIPDLLDYADNGKDDYNHALKDQDLYRSNIEGIKQQQEATKNFRGELLLLDDAYKKGNISQEEYTNAFNKLVEATGNPNFKDTPLDVLLNSDAIDDWSKRLEENLTKNNRLLAESESKTAESTQAMQDLANAGLLELEFGDAEQGLSHIATAVKSADLSMMDWAATAALVQTGQKSLDDVWKQGGDVLDNYVANYISDIQQFGASAEQAALGAALIKNGFTSVQQASSAGVLDIVTQQANELAHSMGLIPEDKHIVINAEGNVSVIEDVQAAIEQVNAAGDVSLQVSANGDISVLDTADEKLQELIANNQVTITFNVNTGGFDISDLQGNKLGEITADGKINWTKGEVEKPEGEKADGTIDYKLGDVEKPQNATATGTINYVVGKVEKPAGLAKGTSNWGGGNALVNDDGSSDPRELIMHDGMAYMYNEPNVITNIPKHATVLTSSQTKAKLRQMGITSYASGKNNSDAFTAAKEDWTHYTKTHAVTTAQELEKWLEFQEKYKDNEKDIWDIEEQIFSLQQKLYSERVKESENWLAHEEKYNGLSVQDYIAGIDRMKAYTEEYYAQGLLNYKEYTEALNDLDEKRLDKVKEGLSEQFDASKAYISEHTYFNDWEDYGDDPLDAYNRVMDRHREALANGELTQEEFDTYGKELGSDMYSERKEQSLNWLEEQRKYFVMTDEEYVQGLERIKAYTQEYYDKGLISRQEYNEAMTELNHSAWDEAEAAYEDMLSQQQEYISDLREQFSEQEQALRDSWDVEDRAVDMADVQNQLDIYAGAVTDRGQQKYKELQEQMKQLQRDEELYNLQVANNAVIEELQAEYEQLEADKATFLQSIASNTEIDVSGIVGELTSGIEQSSNDITRTLSEIIDAIREIKIEQSYYNDNKQITNNFSRMTNEQFSDAADYTGR